MAKWYVREIQTTQLEHPFSCLCNLGKAVKSNNTAFSI